MIRAYLKGCLTSILLLALLFALSACDAGQVTRTALPPTPLPPTPTLTPVPLAVTINGEGISRAEFEAEITRYQAAQSALGNSPTLQEATQIVLDDLVDQVLLAQGAAREGFLVDDALLQKRLDALVAKVGSQAALDEWIAGNGYSQESFTLALRRAVAAAWMRDQIITTVPSTAEQVHVRQILFYNLEQAQEALESLKAGYSFDELAARYDPLTKGELGWFPRGYLLELPFEEAAFSLQPGEYSNIVETSVGYHILKVIEREANRPLSPDALLSLQGLALDNWLQEQRAQSTIILVP